MRLNHAAVSGLALAPLLLCLSSMPLYGAEPLELKKGWQQPGANTERQGTTPQAPPGELQIKENWRQPGTNTEGRPAQTNPGGLQLKKNWRGSGEVAESNTGNLKLKSDWKKPSTEHGNVPTPSSNELKLKNNWKQADTGIVRQNHAPQPPSGLQLKEDWKNSK